MVVDVLNTHALVGEFADLTTEIGEQKRQMETAARRRCEIAGQMHAFGLSYAQIAALLGCSRARVQQLVERSRTW